MRKRYSIISGGAHRRRGVMVAEATIGLVLVITLLMFLSTAVVLHNRGQRRLAVVRATERRVESAMLTLQAGGKVTDEAIVFRRLTDGAPVGGQVWVEASTVAEGHKATLVGMVSISAMSRQEGTHAAP